jgi:hypothetical protein
MNVEHITFTGDKKRMGRCIRHGSTIYVHLADLAHVVGKKVAAIVRRDVANVSRIVIKREVYVDIRTALKVSEKLYPIPQVPRPVKLRQDILEEVRNGTYTIHTREELPWDLRPGRVASVVVKDGEGIRIEKGEA